MTSTILTRLSLLACAAALPATALAGEVPPPTAGELAFTAADVTPTDGRLNKEEFATTFAEDAKPKVVAKAFKKADISKNGSLTLTEFLVHFGEIEEAPAKTDVSFDEADANNSDGITLDELVAVTPGKSPIINIIKTFQVADDDADDILSLAEWTLLKTGKAKPAKGEKFLKFDLADLDEEDDELTPFEFSLISPRGTTEAKIMAKFLKLDKNEDEVLTRDEYNPGGPKTPPAPAP